MKSTRIKTVIFTFYFIFLIIIGRLFYWQIIKHNALSQQVIQQSYKVVSLPPDRGLIYNSSFQPLVLNQTSYQLSLYKPNSKNLDSTLKLLTSIYPTPTEADLKLISQFTNNSAIKWITLSHLFTNDQINSLTDPSFSFSPILQRYYPDSIYYQQLTGILGKNDLGDITGYGGLEGYYHKILTGKAGYQYQSQDAVGQSLISAKNWLSPSVNGRSLNTSINPVAQFQSYRLLTDGIKKFSADSGSIIIMEPKTGHIISLISLNATSSASLQNHSLVDVYEPGSIFKPLVMSMALDNNSLSPDWTCRGCSQPRTIGQYTITNWDNSLHPDSSIYDIIKNSDNIGMSYIISRLGLNPFLDYFNSLGFTRKTGIDLQGESKPPQKTLWPEIDLATAGFGQGLVVTQIQMITAFNALANNGILVKPSLVTSFEDNGNTIPLKIAPGKQVYKTSTVNLMRQILEYAVKNSPVAQYNKLNVPVCAKSGTAQVAVKGSYSDSSATASYIGFAPCDNPKFIMLVTINNPKTANWGSTTAAPIWFELAQIIYPLL